MSCASGTFGRAAHANRHAVLKRFPFRDEALMIGPPPSCSWASFKQPRLRRCPFDLESIRWIGLVGGGLDGLVWKVYFGDEGPFALKVVSAFSFYIPLLPTLHTRRLLTTLKFWQSEMPEGWSYWAAQLECQNAALFEMMAACIEKDAESIYLHREPWTIIKATDNFFSFSDEGRKEKVVKVREHPDDVVRVAPMPRVQEMLRLDHHQRSTLGDLQLNEI